MGSSLKSIQGQSRVATRVSKNSTRSWEKRQDGPLGFFQSLVSVPSWGEREICLFHAVHAEGPREPSGLGELRFKQPLPRHKPWPVWVGLCFRRCSNQKFPGPGLHPWWAGDTFSACVFLYHPPAQGRGGRCEGPRGPAARALPV